MTTTMPFVFLPPPAVPVEIAAKHLARAYGLEAQFHQLGAERDQNFRCETRSGTFLLKICSASEGFSLAEAQVMALQHLAATSPDLPLPRVLPTQSGQAVSSIHHDGVDYPVILLRWLPGEVMAERAGEHLPELARLLAKLGHGLRGFAHAALLERNLVWDVTRAEGLRPLVNVLPANWQDRANRILGEFTKDVKPALRFLRTQVIHGDVHPHNVLLEGHTISGIIDFGDMVHAPLVVDPVNSLVDCLYRRWDMGKSLSAFVENYHAVNPLERPEIEMLLPLARVRLLSGAIITLARTESGLPSILSMEELCAGALEKINELEQRWQELAFTCLNAAGYGAPKQMRSKSAMARRLAAMGPKPLLFYSNPLHMIRGDGVWLHADDGRAYLDCYNNVAHVGHGHPVVAEAVSRQLRILNTNTRYLTDQSIAYAEELKGTMDPSLDTVIFVNSGSEANDVAWRMARAFTGRKGALCMDFAYHGVTEASDALSPSNYPEGKWNFPHVRLLEAPDTYRGRYGHDHPGAGAAYAELAEEAIHALDKAGHGVSIAIMDSAFMTNGILDVPGGYVTGVAERVQRAGGLFIADEVQSGFGRMGSHMWGHQRHGLVPDFVTIGKPAGNGYPVGAIITRSEILSRFVEEAGPFFSTFGGGNAACAAGLAVLRVLDHEQLVAKAKAVGEHFRTDLRKLMQRHEIIGDVRGAGLAIGVELVLDRRSKAPARAETRRVLDLVRDEGVLIGSDGKLGNVLKLRPPMVFGLEHADQTVAAIDAALRKL